MSDKIYVGRAKVWIVLVPTFAACAGLAALHTLLRMAHWHKGHARVVRYHVGRSDDDDGQSFFYPVYRFETPDGQSHIGHSRWGSWRRSWPVGEQITIRYSPSNPDHSEVQCFASDWGLAATLMALSLGCWLILYWLPQWLHASTPL